MLSIIDRHIVKLFLGFFLAGLTTFVTIVLAADFIHRFIRYSDVEEEVFLRFYIYWLPEILVQMIPLACLVGAIFTFSTLHRSNELVALLGMGHRLTRVAAPALMIVSLLSTFSFWMSDRIVPMSSKKKNYVKYVEIKKRPGLYVTVKTNKIWYKSGSILFNIKTLNPSDSTAQGLTMYYMDKDDWKLIQQIQARFVKIRNGLWELHNGFITHFKEGASFPEIKPFEKKEITMGEELHNIQSSTNAFEIMTLKQLDQFIKRHKEAGLDTLSYEVNYHQRFAFAFIALIFVLLSIPLSMSQKRSGGTFASVALCIALALVYWIVFKFSLALGQSGTVPPMISAWAPNVLFLTTSLYLFNKRS